MTVTSSDSGAVPVWVLLGALVGLLSLSAVLSISIGFMNLLPIPVLDGGHLMFLSFEMITGKAVPLLVQHKATMVGLALLLGLMLFATFNDILRIFS